MKENPCKIMVDRRNIAILEDRLLAQYKGMVDERSQIHDWEWENDFDFTILGLMELYSSDIGGLASQIATGGRVINPKGALKVLSESRLFDEEYFTEWYFAPDNNYVKVKKYIENLNYLRLLAHEYITNYQNGMSSATDSVHLFQSNGSQDAHLSVTSEEMTDNLSMLSLSDGVKVLAESDQLLVSSS